jgi:hypothetical protein
MKSDGENTNKTGADHENTENLCAEAVGAKNRKINCGVLGSRVVWTPKAYCFGSYFRSRGYWEQS